jgi:hypothetical protein
MTPTSPPQSEENAATSPDVASPPPLPRDGQPQTITAIQYTTRGLVALFCWLLWFDFSFTLMEAVLGPIIQFHLLGKDGLNCDPWLYKTLMGTVPSILAIFWTPFLSIKSDRHRGPRGRRVPFLLYGAPPVCLCLAVIGFGNEIGQWIQATILTGTSVATVTIWTFGILCLIYMVFNTYLGTTFYYLFNDVVPPQHFVKFMAWMRAVGGVAMAVYSWFLFGYSAKSGPLTINLAIHWPFNWQIIYWHVENIWYPKIILVGAAIFYLLAGTIPMLRIKEPKYPPPAPLAEGDTFVARTAQTLKTLTKECFCHRFYVIFFVTQIVVFMGYQMGDFMNPARQEMGIDLDALGKLGAVVGLISIPLIFVTGVFGDRFHPMPLMVVAMAFQLTTAPIQMLFLIPGLSPQTYYYIQIASNVIWIPVSLVTGLAEWPLGMSILPRERYGQFCGVAAMLRNILAMVLGSQFAGLLMGVLKEHFGAYAGRFAFAWNFLFAGLGLLCYYLLYRQWKRLGGRKGFAPPPVDGGAVRESINA